MTPDHQDIPADAVKSPFIDPCDLPKAKLADGTLVNVSHKFVRMKKSRLGRRFNGKHKD